MTFQELARILEQAAHALRTAGDMMPSSVLVPKLNDFRLLKTLPGYSEMSTQLQMILIKTRASGAFVQPIRTVADLCSKTEQEMFEYRNFGQHRLSELRHFMSMNNLKFRDEP